MTKKIKFGFALDGGCPKNSMAVIEPLPRIDINDIVLYNVFQKNFSVTSFVAQLGKIINGPHGKINVMITLDSAPFSEMTEAKKFSIPVKYRSACNWVNRFPPDNLANFSAIVNELINTIDAAGLMPYISWQLWQEPNSPKYFHGTFADFEKWTMVKYYAVKQTGRHIYVGDFAASLITDFKKKNQFDYYNWIDSAPLFADPQVRFSTSFYWINSAGVFDEENNTYPQRSLPHTAITGYNLGNVTKERINSDEWLSSMLSLLIWIYDKPDIEIIYFWNLLDCNNHDSKGKFSAWAKNENGYTPNQLWRMINEVLDVLRMPDGTMEYRRITNGIEGHKWKMGIDADGYVFIG